MAGCAKGSGFTPNAMNVSAPSEAALRECFDFTPAECRVARLLCGGSVPKAIARDLATIASQERRVLGLSSPTTPQRLRVARRALEVRLPLVVDLQKKEPERFNTLEGEFIRKSACCGTVSAVLCPSRKSPRANMPARSPSSASLGRSTFTTKARAAACHFR